MGRAARDVEAPASVFSVGYFGDAGLRVEGWTPLWFVKIRAAGGYSYPDPSLGRSPKP